MDSSDTSDGGDASTTSSSVSTPLLTQFQEVLLPSAGAMSGGPEHYASGGTPGEMEQRHHQDFEDQGGGKMTAALTVTCLMAASGGLIFGYDIGVSGGVTTMGPFLQKFFPDVWNRTQESVPRPDGDGYCVYDSQALTAFTSSLYLAGLFSSLIAGHVSKVTGRRRIMILGGTAFLVGATLCAAAADLAMLIVGRIILGIGVGFTNQSTPLYLAEMAPARWRGAMNTGFQFFLGVGVLGANLTNYYAAGIAGGWGWRLSLGLAAVPATVLLLGSLIIPDIPSSLAARGDIAGARRALQRVRGNGVNVERELAQIVQSVEAMRVVDSEGPGPFKKLAWEKRHRPHLVMAVCIPLFQQMTGINVVAFYAPVLFRTVGFGSGGALLAAVILGTVNLASILVAAVVVDKYGRKALFLEGGAQMLLCQVALVVILETAGSAGAGGMGRALGVTVLSLMCLYAAGFGWSWGPLSWVVPAEIFPSEVRSAGQALGVAVNLGTTTLLAQVFLAMLCKLKGWTFGFYAVWVIVMTAFVATVLPETKGIPLDRMEEVWAKHWFWRKYYGGRKGEGYRNVINKEELSC